MSPFFLENDIWEGKGTISFSSAQESLIYHTHWKKKGKSWINTVQIIGNEEKLINTFTFFNIQEGEFSLTIENKWVGKIEGKGTFDEEGVYWQFSDNSEMNGYEKWRRQKDDRYQILAEYNQGFIFSTKIEGCLWKSQEV